MDMAKKGYAISGEECDRKWRNLMFRYKKIIDNRQSTGKGRMVWEFFGMMDDVLGESPAIRPVLTISTMNGVNKENERPTSSSSVPPMGPSASVEKSPQNITEKNNLQNTSSSQESQPSCSTSQTSTPGRRKRRRPGQAPDWLIEMREEQRQQFDTLKALGEQQIELTREKNGLLKELIDTLKNK